MSIYTDIILEYYRNPINKGKMKDASTYAKDSNPFCGDEIEIFIKIKNERIDKVMFNGKGCAISIASASMLTEFIKGKKLEEAAKVCKSDIFNMLGVRLSPNRIKCALLPLKVFKLALYKYMGKHEH